MATKKITGSHHAHGCSACHTRYEDACLTPDQDQKCSACRGLKAWQYLIDSFGPHQCCRETARLVNKDDKQRYKLAGKHLWFICRTCSRTHPFDPKPKAPR